MRINLISTGDEVLQGEIDDTNASFAASLLTDHGFSIGRRYTVPDDRSDIARIITAAMEDADAVLCCGGLGPTRDDLTAEAASMALGVPLVLNQPVVDELKRRFAKVGYPWTPNQERQGRLPEGARVLQNRWGTAPGILAQKNGRLLVCLPGPPREFRPMLAGETLERLQEARTRLGDSDVIAKRVLRVFGKGEGWVENTLGDLATEVPGVSVGFRAALPEILVKLRAVGTSREKAEEILGRAEKLARSRLEKWVVATGNTTLPEVVVGLLKDKNSKLAVAESCTGGLLGKLLTDVPGSSEVFVLSAVTYANEMKTKVLGVPEELLESHGAVSEACARAMAEGVKKLSGADIGVSITGIAGPEGGTEDKPVGTVHFAVCDREGTTTHHRRFPLRDRESIRSFAAHTALALIRLRVLP